MNERRSRLDIALVQGTTKETFQCFVNGNSLFPATQSLKQTAHSGDMLQQQNETQNLASTLEWCLVLTSRGPAHV